METSTLIQPFAGRILVILENGQLKICKILNLKVTCSAPQFLRLMKIPWNTKTGFMALKNAGDFSVVIDLRPASVRLSPASLYRTILETRIDPEQIFSPKTSKELHRILVILPNEEQKIISCRFKAQNSRNFKEIITTSKIVENFSSITVVEGIGGYIDYIVEIKNDKEEMDFSNDKRKVSETEPVLTKLEKINFLANQTIQDALYPTDPHNYNEENFSVERIREFFPKCEAICLSCNAIVEDIYGCSNCHPEFLEPTNIKQELEVTNIKEEPLDLDVS